MHDQFELRVISYNLLFAAIIISSQYIETHSIFSPYLCLYFLFFFNSYFSLFNISHSLFFSLTISLTQTAGREGPGGGPLDQPSGRPNAVAHTNGTYSYPPDFSTSFHPLSLPLSVLYPYHFPVSFSTSFHSLSPPPSILFVYLLMHSICHGFPVYLFCFLIFLQLLPPFASQYIYVFIIYLRNFLFSFLLCCCLSLFLLQFLSTYICFS